MDRASRIVGEEHLIVSAASPLLRSGRESDLTRESAVVH